MTKDGRKTSLPGILWEHLMLFLKGPGGISEAAKIIWPLMLSNAVTAVMQSTDRIFLSQYGQGDELKASLPAGLLGYLLLCIQQVTISYSGTFVAQFHGAGKTASCARTLAQTVWLTVFTIPVTLLMIPVGHILFNICGHEPVMLAMEKQYFDIIMCGGTLLPMLGALAGYLSGLGKTRLVMRLTVIGCVMNVVLDYLLIFGKFGIPSLGIRGAAWATVISFFSTMVLMAIWSFKERHFLGSRAKFTWRRDMPLMKRIISFGAPAAFHTALDMLTFTFFVFVTGHGTFAKDQVLMSTIVLTINHMLFAPLAGIGLGASIVVGNCQGRKDPVAANRAGWASLAIGWLYMSLSCLLVIYFSDPLLRLFLANENSLPQENLNDALEFGKTLILIMASWGMFDASNAILGGALKGAGDTKFVMHAGITAGIGLWIPMLVAVWFFWKSIPHLWYTQPAYLLILSAILGIRWVRGHWKTIQLIPTQNRDFPGQDLLEETKTPEQEE